jgi:hypothetical protein
MKMHLTNGSTLAQNVVYKAMKDEETKDKDKKEKEEKVTTEEKASTAKKTEAANSKEDEKKKEEVEDEKEEVKVNEENKDEQKDKSPDVPKVASFSMLDTPTPPQKNEKNAQEKSEKKDEKEEDTDEVNKDEEGKAKDDEKVSSDEVKEWLKDIRPDTTKEVEKKSGSKFKVFLGFFVLLLVIAAVVGGVFYYQKGVGGMIEPTDQEDQKEPGVTVEEPSATPTEEPLDLSSYRVSVLNGSGVAGAAANAKDELEEAGFEEVNIGNADSSDYDSTVVSKKESVDEKVFEKVRDTLSNDYSVVKSDENLEEDSTYDVIIILGVPKS